MPLRIVIPSHRRWDRVLAKRLVQDPIICVAESQEAIYRDYNPDCEIVTHPDSVVGLIPKRNWMARHFGDLFMLDDDVHVVRRLYVEKGESAPIRDPAEVTAVIARLHELAEMLDIHLYGFSSAVTPVMYSEEAYLSLSHMITGCAYGVRPSKNIWWNEDVKLKEDFWISCYVKYKERRVLTDGRYNFAQKGTFVSAGGLAGIRNQDEERRSILFMRKSFGECIRLKGVTNNGKGETVQKVKYNIVAKFPF